MLQSVFIEFIRNMFIFKLQNTKQQKFDLWMLVMN